MLICKGADNSIRWSEGERLDHLFEARCDELDAASGGTHVAVFTDERTHTFRDLDNRANQAARHLISKGVKSGDKVGLLFDKGVDTYIALLAVLKVNAAYVPFDGGFPNDRIAFIMEDASVKVMLTQSGYQDKVADFDVPSIFLDGASNEIDKLETSRLSEDEKGKPKDEVAYLIYTSGTTGQPKGVVIEHASICNFVRVAAEIYGYGPEDRVYQGMTIAFDFSVEELWVPLLAGSALVPAKAGSSLVGDDLADYLLEHKVTGWACVPTLLGTIEKDLPELRLLIVSGEACPQNLVTRWARDGRVILNAYGPTEATVTCTLTELLPDKPVTIGGPLPTYTIVILDPDKPEIVPEGKMGEIGIAGVGLAQGYLKRPELTDEKFIPDFLDIPNNPSKRIYRSGDLGCINTDDEVEFHGRIDTQVKVRGYRIELTEIESVLMEFPQISMAVVDTYEPEPGAVELVAYYALNKGQDDIDHSEVAETLRARMPGYMVPAFIEKLDIIPMTPSNKADRKALPEPKGPRVAAGGGDYVAPSNETEEKLANTLAAVMNVDEVSAEANFFHDLGAHSLLMARYCAEIRKIDGMPDVAMRDVYLNPTIVELAKILSSAGEVQPLAIRDEQYRVPSNFEYYGCGAAQFIFTISYALLSFWVLLTGIQWTYDAVGEPLELYTRIVTFLIATYLGFSIFSIAMKWALVGKWKAESFPVWSLRYFRFWMVKMLTSTAPMALFPGGPVYNLYLSLLGAKIGSNVIIGSTAPVCTDLFKLGDNSIIRNKSLLPGYNAVGNILHTGPIHIGARSFVGSGCVLEMDTAMEDDTQLGHSSALQTGQRVPEGKHFHGTPAEETSANYCDVASMNCTALRRWVYTIALGIPLFGIIVPILLMALYRLYPYALSFTSVEKLNYDAPFSVLFNMVPGVFIVCITLFVALLVLGTLIATLVPKFFNMFLNPGKTYVLFGFHYYALSIISSVSNSPVFNLLFGDSSYIVYYLRWLGYKLNRVEQTGANFGLDQVHDNPLMCNIGSGTMVSDGLAMINAQASSTSFRLDQVKIGDHNYLGNNILYPADGKTGANVLLATKVMIPIDGPVRENVGLLGSPPFEIPRVVERDKGMSEFVDPKTKLDLISQKNRRNVATMTMYLAVNFLLFFIAALTGYMALIYYPIHGMGLLLATGAGLSLFSILYFLMMEKASLHFGSLEPREVSMYEPYFWFHERHWKFCGHPLTFMFAGTPLKNLITRMLGVKLGKKVFDDGGNLYDKTLIEIGDYTNLNLASVVQCHSLEEGVFKSEHVKIGKGCTLACGSFVHYGVTMGDNVVLGPNAFLMKGETLQANTIWEGNPARAIREMALQLEAAE
jgi:non-ribosomal peptide synthetase-like protein